jgi:hypothetical protein
MGGFFILLFSYLSLSLVAVYFPASHAAHPTLCVCWIFVLLFFYLSFSLVAVYFPASHDAPSDPVCVLVFLFYYFLIFHYLWSPYISQPHTLPIRPCACVGFVCMRICVLHIYVYIFLIMGTEQPMQRVLSGPHKHGSGPYICTSVLFHVYTFLFLYWALNSPCTWFWSICNSIFCSHIYFF